jgi:outer membrane protein
MKKIILLAAISAATLAVPAAVQAQAAPSILIVDTDTIMQTCTACRAAAAQLQSQQNAIQTRRNSLASQFDTEAKSIDAEGKALGGKAPGPALKAKAQSLQSREDQAQQELQNSIDRLKSTAAHVQQQIGEKLVQVVDQVRARRRAAVIFSKNAALANDPSLDVTSEALAALNQQLPSGSVTPMPQQQTSGQSQGR